MSSWQPGHDGALHVISRVILLMMKRIISRGYNTVIFVRQGFERAPLWLFRPVKLFFQGLLQKIVVLDLNWFLLY